MSEPTNSPSSKQRGLENINSAKQSRPTNNQNGFLAVMVALRALASRPCHFWPSASVCVKM